MKPAWDQLGDEYASSSSVVIGDADCTASGKSLCDANDVRGYPTIKYYNAENPDGAAYNGGRDFDSLKKFTDENLSAKCLLDDTEGCSDKEKEFMEKWKAKVCTRGGAARWVRSKMERRLPPPLQHEGDAAFDAQEVASKLVAELADRWNAGIGKIRCLTDQGKKRRSSGRHRRAAAGGRLRR